MSNRAGVRRKNASAEPPGCPLTAALRAIGGKWNLICLYWLELEPRRFNELRRLSKSEGGIGERLRWLAVVARMRTAMCGAVSTAAPRAKIDIDR